jgi:D-proline reductase (dithiol) PrdB
MARLSDLSVAHRFYLRRYPFDRYCSGEGRGNRLARPLAGCRVGIVSSAGLCAAKDEAFDLDRRGGDPSFRILPADVDPADLRVHHRSDAFDHRPLERDREVAFPISVLRELATEGAIGSLAPASISFMGSVTRPRRLIDETAPAAARQLRAWGVDVALLVPV